MAQKKGLLEVDSFHFNDLFTNLFLLIDNLLVYFYKQGNNIQMKKAPFGAEEYLSRLSFKYNLWTKRQNDLIQNLLKNTGTNIHSQKTRNSNCFALIQLKVSVNGLLYERKPGNNFL